MSTTLEWANIGLVLSGSLRWQMGGIDSYAELRVSAESLDSIRIPPWWSWWCRQNIADISPEYTPSNLNIFHKYRLRDIALPFSSHWDIFHTWIILPIILQKGAAFPQISPGLMNLISTCCRPLPVTYTRKLARTWTTILNHVNYGSHTWINGIYLYPDRVSKSTSHITIVTYSYNPNQPCSAVLSYFVTL